MTPDGTFSGMIGGAMELQRPHKCCCLIPCSRSRSSSFRVGGLIDGRRERRLISSPPVQTVRAKCRSVRAILAPQAVRVPPSRLFCLAAGAVASCHLATADRNHVGCGRQTSGISPNWVAMAPFGDERKGALRFRNAKVRGSITLGSTKTGLVSSDPERLLSFGRRHNLPRFLTFEGGPEGVG